MVFDILKRYRVGTKQRQFFEKKSFKKMKKTVQKLYISSFSVFFFSRDTPKCPWHTFLEFLSRAHLTFHGHFFENCHGHFFSCLNPKIVKSFYFWNLSRALFLTFCHGHFFEKCHGHFTEVTGTFSKNVTGKSKNVTWEKKHWVV